MKKSTRDKWLISDDRGSAFLISADYMTCLKVPAVHQLLPILVLVRIYGDGSVVFAADSK
jgi:hypothetical protein